ncbi:MAG TPA: response regulator transcription factor [Kineosporiaceae bacterium]|nr:response regulator transcription factor [Kineosporiaceae bacterium]
MDRIRIMLVDDHRVMRQGVRMLLELQPDFEIVAEADTGTQALELIDREPPDIVVLDLKLTDLSGTQVCRRAMQRHPDLSVLILTAISDGPDVLECIDAGAKGYVLKDVDVEELGRTIRAIHRGESVLDSKVTRAVLDRARSAPGGEPEGPLLTDQEKAIVGLIAEGLTNKEIGERLYMSASAVKFHISDIMQKLDVKRRAQVVFKAAGDHLI